MTAEDFRRLALALDDVVERAHMGHPDFRANGRIFATLQADDEWGMVKLTPAEQRVMMRTHPKTFVPASGAWGRQGCTMVRLAAADEATVRGAILLAWQLVMAQRPGRPSAAPRSRGARRPGRRAP